MKADDVERKFQIWTDKQICTEDEDFDITYKDSRLRI
jgi:hypothetical protein